MAQDNPIVYRHGILNPAIAHQKWLLSERAEYDVGTPVAVDRIIERWEGIQGKGFVVSEDSFLSTLSSLPPRDRIIEEYLFSSDKEFIDPIHPENTQPVSHCLGEILRFACRKGKVLSRKLVDTYAAENHLNDTMRYSIAQELNHRLIN